MQNIKVVEILKQGGVGILPTDTLYGLVCSALNSKSVERVYRLRRRSPDKPSIILISEIADLKLFGIYLDQFTEDFLISHWPAPLSVVLPCLEDKFEYLHRGTKTLAFRVPDDENLRSLLSQTGPLIAPSAN